MKSIIYNISPALNLSFLIAQSKQPVFLPFYHTISDEILPHIQPLYPVKSVKTFEADLDYLLKCFQPIDIQEIVKHANGEQKITKPSFHLSFDDGLKECFEIIAPILKRKGIPASFFINSNFVDNRALFYRYKVALILHHLNNSSHLEMEIKMAGSYLKVKKLFKNDIVDSLLLLNHSHHNIIDKCAEFYGIDFKEFLKTQQPYMTSAEIQQLSKDGFHIGAHSQNHPNYTDISIQQQINQTIKSVAIVQKNTPSTIKSFAFPFSSDGVSRDFFNLTHSFLDVSFGTSGIKTDVIPNHLQRFPMEGTSLSTQKLVKGAYLHYLLKRPFGKHIYNR